MKRLVGMATMGGLTMSLGLLGLADGAAAAPAARPPAPPGAANAAAPARAARPAKPAAATPGRTPNAAAAKGQAQAAAVRNVPAAAAARSNRPGSANRATGQARAARVQALNAAAAAQHDAAAREAAAAAPVAAAAEPGGGQDKVLLCHVTSSDTEPFTLIEVASPAAVNAHLSHGDIAAVNGACPEPVVPPAADATVAICHRTGVEGTPFSLIDVNATDLPGHIAHGDVATVGGVCPGAVVLPASFTQPTAGPAGVRAAAITEATPARVEQQLLSTRVRIAENKGALPVTGVEVGSLVAVGLAMLVVGGRLVRSGRLRRDSASTATA